MQRITEIQIQRRNKERVNVYINNKYSFSCSKEIVVSHKLKVGLEIDKNQMIKIIDDSNEKHAFQISLYYLSFKPRTKQEVIDYLVKKEFEEKTIDKTLEKLISYRFIDDKQYAINFISSKIRQKNKSSTIVKNDLIKKGISVDMVDDAISIFSYDIDLDIAKKISEKYFNRNHNLPFNQVKDKLCNMLFRKGFSWEIINNCISDLENNDEVKSIIDSNKEEYIIQARKLAQKYFSKYRKKEDNQYLLEKKVKSALYRKGYDKDIIAIAFENIKKN